MGEAKGIQADHLDYLTEQIDYLKSQIGDLSARLDAVESGNHVAARKVEGRQEQTPQAVQVQEQIPAAHEGVLKIG